MATKFQREFYPVRASSNLTNLKSWMKEYWKMRIKGGFEDRYTVYASYD